MHRSAYIVLLLTTLLWGGNSVAGKLAVDGLHASKPGRSDDSDDAVVIFQFNGVRRREPLG